MTCHHFLISSAVKEKSVPVVIICVSEHLIIKEELTAYILKYLFRTFL
jgi:hypothetical protein